ncbi:CXXC-20-CXXC protein [Alkalihalobacillus xiaoxiensis]|uniref:CXXC-20-CXXC protein n=1 Tax=Shouchella xiaoxiensis TaxID=766895 RepID=A0ABS2SMQ9_9BACI|nr:hypothetical protein [Shouchella xiaoxiensis]MBM7836804.1 CXXC-20-CXXC protein [Shouchella xiaoxiensis]
MRNRNCVSCGQEMSRLSVLRKVFNRIKCHNCGHVNKISVKIFFVIWLFLLFTVVIMLVNQVDQLIISLTILGFLLLMTIVDMLTLTIIEE